MSLNFKKFFRWFKKAKTPTTLTIKSSIQPDRDWKLMFIFFFILATLIAAGHLYLFIKVGSGEMYETNTMMITSSGSIDQERLERVIRTYREQASRLEILKQRPLLVPDPSF